MIGRHRQTILIRLLSLSVVALLLQACQSSCLNLKDDDEHSRAELMGTQKIHHRLNRNILLERLKQEHFDILVIGGGATGSGAVLDAASRGLKVALVEAFDYSFGTSSRSTKLIHGGVRYLENAVKYLDGDEYALVRDALKERKRFLENAPHLTNPLPILTPVYTWFEAGYYLIGLKLYDFVAGKASLGRSHFIGKEQALALFPMLKPQGLKGAVVYYDGQFDDARMNVSLILTALLEGAAALNYVAAESLYKEQEKVKGAYVVDRETGERFLVKAQVVINATGTYADAIRKMDDPQAKDIIVPSQGSHVLLPSHFSSRDYGLIIPKTKDGRVLFLLPWMGKTMAGTTDKPTTITTLPQASQDEVAYIIDHVRQYFAAELTNTDVIATWSGLRPLARPEAETKATAAISRDHLIDVSQTDLITIVGGKWTTYRKMGEDVIDTAVSVGRLVPKEKSRTKDLLLLGARFFKENLEQELVAYEDIAADMAAHLVKSYGDRVDAVIDVGNKSHRKRLIEGFPYMEAEVLYAVREEYALHATDVIARRLRLAFLDNRAAIKSLPRVIQLMGEELAWDQARKEQELQWAESFLASMLTTDPSP